jgi:hypothetical protein
VKSELKRIWSVMVEAQCDALPRHLPGRTDKNTKLHSVYCLRDRNMELGPLTGRTDTRCTVPSASFTSVHSKAYAESESVCPHVTALRNKYVTLFQRVTSCSFVRTDVLNKCAGRLPSRWKQHVRLKRRCMSTKLHGITFLKAVFAVTVVGIRNLTRKN